VKKGRKEGKNMKEGWQPFVDGYLVVQYVL
jgi:hypothetical protein